jgi:hypothetical protein
LFGGLRVSGTGTSPCHAIASNRERLKHHKGEEPANLPGPEEFQECMERHPYADPDAVWTFLLFQPPPPERI